jgi:hypothetical protein
MIDYRVALVLEAGLMYLNVFHMLFTVLFFISFGLILFKKYSPYSQLYLVGFMTLQIIWNGCTITDIINILNAVGRYEFTPNGFIWNVGGEQSQLYRLAFLVMSPLLFYNAFYTWEKVQTHLDFGNYFRRGDFEMGK